MIEKFTNKNYIYRNVDTAIVLRKTTKRELLLRIGNIHLFLGYILSLK